jgi:pyruvate, water dikinase
MSAEALADVCQYPMTAPLAGLPADARAMAGGKGASLSRMAQAGLPVPPGFVVLADAFGAMLESCNGAERIRELAGGLDVSREADLQSAAAGLRELILSHPAPQPIEAAIRDAYLALGEAVLVAVRSSAVAEDGEAASYAGQQETFLNVRGVDAVIRRVRECWASFFAPRALFYRAQKGKLTDTAIAVVVQQMVMADRSGVLFTIDPVHKHSEHMVIEAVFGLGEGIVSGLITPDHYVVDRSNGSVIREFIAVQPAAIIYDSKTGATVEAELSAAEGGARVLSQKDLARLWEAGLRLEKLFGGPQDIEWSFHQGDLFLLQSRPITTL